MAGAAADVVVRMQEGARATFTLAPEMDDQRGTIDLTAMLDVLVASGIRRPRANPDDGVPFGDFSTEGEISVEVGGTVLTEEQVAQHACSGLVNAIYDAIDHADRLQRLDAAEGGSGEEAAQDGE